MSVTALLLPGLDIGHAWTVRGRSDRAATSLVDRHYSRPERSRGCGHVGGPGHVLVLVTPCERAVWLTTWTDYPDDGLHAWRCTVFRNEGAGRSSDLIRTAMALTAELWGDSPADGWVTWVNTSKVASANPGFCFKKAGWWLDREWRTDRRRPHLVRLRAAA